MAEQNIMVRTEDGEMPTMVVYPDKGGPFPLVIALMHAGGIEEGLRRNARELAVHGYYVMLPHLYYRQFGTGPTEDVSDWDRLIELDGATTRETATRDVLGCVRAAEADPHARGTDHFGIAGYCMGGRLAVEVGQVLGAQLAAATSLHPGPTDPTVDNLKAKMYFGAAEHDEYFTPEIAAPLLAAMDKAGVDYEFDIIPNTEHGFSVPGRPHYSAEGSRRALDKTLALFRERL